jgi:signal transduction histidine kinase
MEVKKIRHWRERLRELLVKEPSFISLTLRWFGWLVAFVIVVARSAPELNLKDAPWVLAITGGQLLLMSLYPKYMRPRLKPEDEQKVPQLWPLIDIAIAVWSIYQTGGWDSPFYHFGVTVVLGPSLRFGLMGALLSSTLFSALFLLVVKLTQAGFSPAYAGMHAEPDLISSPLNPLMIGLYAAFLGEVLKKLRREMERSSILAAENERARMARDIHDGVSQTLFMLTMSLETGQVLAQKENAAKTQAHLEKLTPVAQKALIELRNAMHDVEPLAEGRQSLDKAVEQLTRDYRSATGLNIEFSVCEDFCCPAHLASVLFRISQEALSNACQHSGGTEINVGLNHGELIIEDNGTGFDQETIKRGRGLGNLEKRADEAQIDYSLETGAGGTRVVLRWKEES